MVTRGSVLIDEQGGIGFYARDDENPSTEARMRRHLEHASPLAERAARAALLRSEVKPGDVTHLVTASCTGFESPGADQHIIQRLGLPGDVRRTHVGFMGCHAAINALAVASAFASADPGARVLVCCVELCTLHFAFDADPERHVANALFADGAASAVVAASETESVRFERFASVILPGTAEHMTWTIGDHGFEMRLSPAVPVELARHVPRWVRGWLGEIGLVVGDIASWAIHPGGPRVLSSVLEALGLDASAGGASRGVLAEHGNMSSATVLFIIERLLREGAGLPLAAMAFGPGLAGEGLLLTGRY